MTTEFENENVLDGFDDLVNDGQELDPENPERVFGEEQQPAEPEPEGEEQEPEEGQPKPEGEEPAKPPAKAAPKTDTVPLATHLETKHQLRDMKLRLAQLEAERMVPQPAANAEPEKSPMEMFIEAEGEDAVPTAKVLRDQSQWERRQQQAAQTAGADSVASRAVAVAVRSMTDDVQGEGLGFETLLQVGSTFLTQGDIVDIKAAGANAGKVMYDRLLERTIRSGTPQGQLVRAAYIQARKASSTPQKPKPAATPAHREAPTREQVVSRKPRIQGSDDLTDFFNG